MQKKLKGTVIPVNNHFDSSEELMTDIVWLCVSADLVAVGSFHMSWLLSEFGE